MRVKALLGGLAALAILGLPGFAVADPGGEAQTQAPLYGTTDANAIPGRYIVVLRDGAAQNATEQEARSHGGEIHHRYQAALHGFAASLSNQAVERLRRNPNVAYVEADSTVSIVGDQADPPSWGLDRVDQRNLPLDDNYHYDFTGSGVRAYIIDTGIYFDHNDFGGRAVSGFDAIDGGSADDCHGHGTHVAGTVGGTSFGVAKDVTLVGVRVLNCNGSGTTSQVVAGIDWVTDDHDAGEAAVANMSLGGGANTSIDNAVRNSIADGVTYAVAAGNESTDACSRSPARVAEAITVGATDRNDTRASFSNYGTCLDLFAPGVSITSAWIGSPTATNTISGTSMATPHVAGAAALYKEANPSATPQQVRDGLVNNATTGVVGNPGAGSPNRLLYTLFGGSPPPPPPPPPPSGCDDLEDVFTGSLSGSGDSDVHPDGTYFYAPAGRHRGCLDGPAGVDFDIYLYRWVGWYWRVVAQGITPAPDEDVTYDGTAGYYYWRVRSYEGAGSYTFGMNRP